MPATTERPSTGRFLLSSPTSCAAPPPAPEDPVRVVPLVVAGVLATLKMQLPCFKLLGNYPETEINIL